MVKRQTSLNSIYLKYKLFGEYPRWYHDSSNLNHSRKHVSTSSSADSQIRSALRNTETTRRFTFTFTPKGSTLALQMELRSLESLDATDVHTWLTDFKQVAKNCEWTEEVATATLKAIVSSDIRRTVDSLRSLESIERTLLKVRYPPAHKLAYLNKLEKVSQSAYPFIKDYFDEVCSIFSAYCLCADLKKVEQAHRLEEAFMRGLHPVTLEAALCAQLSTTETIIQFVTSIEEMLLNTPMQEEEPKTPKMHASTNTPQSVPIKTAPLQTKFCKRHGNCLHTTADCKVLKQNSATQSSNKNISSYLICEPKLGSNILSLKGSLQKTAQIFVLDPGATQSIMSEKVAAALQLPLVPLEVPKEVEQATGVKTNVTYSSRIHFNLDQIPNTTFTESVLILPGSQDKVLLGETFLKTHRAIIDYNLGRIEIAGYSFFISEKAEDWAESPDRDLLNTAFLASKPSTETLMPSCNKLLQQISDTPDELKIITGFSMPIQLTNNVPLKAQPLKQPIIHYKTGESNVVADQLSRVFFSQATTASPLFNPGEYETDSFGKFKPSKEQVHKVLQTAHTRLNHPGVSTLINTLRPYWNIPKLREKVKELKRRCIKCQKHFQAKYKYGKVHGHIGTDHPFQDISSDIYGPIDSFIFEEGREKSKLHFLTISDRATRWTEVFILNNLSGKSVCKHFSTWISRHGIPNTCLTDQGRQYIGSEFQSFLEDHNIHPLLATAYNPTGNSISERINQTITRVLKTNTGTPLKTVLYQINWTLQNQYNRSLGASPHELSQGYSLFDPLKPNTSHLLETCFQRASTAAKQDQNQINQKRIPYVYSLNQMVMKKSTKLGKLTESWEGPFRIISHNEAQNIFTLQGLGKAIQANVKQIRPL